MAIAPVAGLTSEIFERRPERSSAQPVPRKPQVAELCRQLLIGRGLLLVAQTRLVQRDVRERLRRGALRLRRDQQEGLRAETAGADTCDVHQQLVAGQRQRADHPDGSGCS